MTIILKFIYCAVCLILLTSQTYGQSLVEDNITKVDTIHILSYKKTLSKHYTGWSVSYIGIKDVMDKFTIPVRLSYGNRSLNETYLKKFELSSLNTISINLGFDGYEQIMKGLFLNLGLGPNIGVEFSETNTSDKSCRSYFSGGANIGLLWIPFKELGITIGSTVFGSLSNSKYVSRDWGIGFEVGVNF